MAIESIIHQITITTLMQMTVVRMLSIPRHLVRWYAPELPSPRIRPSELVAVLSMSMVERERERRERRERERDGCLVVLLLSSSTAFVTTSESSKRDQHTLLRIATLPEKKTTGRKRRLESGES